MTTPRGTDTLELPRNLSGLLKNARRDVSVFRLDGVFFSPRVGSCCEGLDDGAILEARRRRSMAAVAYRGRTVPADGDRGQRWD